MKNKFKKTNRTYFLDKDQIAPNRLIFNSGLSDAAVRLLLVLNGLPETWTPVQLDLEQRLNWSRKKMTHTIQECVFHGYILVHQRRGKRGRFSYNVFEFDVFPSFVENASTDTFQPDADFGARSTDDDPPRENPFSPDLQPCAKTPCAVKDTLACSLYELQKTTTEHEETPVVVVPLDEQLQAKRAALAPYDFDEYTVQSLTSFPLLQITNAIDALHQYQMTNPVTNPNGWLRNAVIGQWKPNSTKAQLASKTEADKLVEEKKKAQKVKQIILEARQAVQKVQHLFSHQRGYNVSFGNDGELAHIRYPNGSTNCIHLVTEANLAQLKSFLKQIN